MSNGKRSIGLFGVSGVLVAVLIIAAFVTMGGIFQAQAKITIKVMDAPTTIDQLWLTIDWIKIQEVDEGWIDISMTESPKTFNLFEFKDETLTLSDEVTISEGDYSMIQMHVQTASTTYGGNDLTVPSDVIKVLLLPQMHLEGGAGATVVIDLQLDDPNSIAISHSLNLRPIIRSVTQNDA